MLGQPGKRLSRGKRKAFLSCPTLCPARKTFQQGYSCGYSPEQSEVAAIPLLPHHQHCSQHSGMKPQQRRHPGVEQQLSIMEKGMPTCESPPRRETAIAKQNPLANIPSQDR